VAVFVSLSNPLRKSDEEIRENLLKITPIGTSMEDVLKAIENNKKWKILQEGSWKSWPSLPDKIVSIYKNFFIKIKLINVLLGTYWGFFEMYVGAHWKFDENLKLIDIYIQKNSASL